MQRWASKVEERTTGTSRWLGFVFALAALLLLPGCLSLDQTLLRRTAFVAQLGSGSALSVRKTPRNPLENELNLLGWKGPTPSDRTQQVLRRYGLEGAYQNAPDEALGQLRRIVNSEARLESTYALAELTYIQGFRAKSARDNPRAMSLFAESLITSYDYLFAPHMESQRNAYDPQFRGICDLYNVSLEEIMRLMRDEKLLGVGTSTELVAGERVIPVDIALLGRWQGSELDRLEFASDYEVEGLENKHHTYGLGVPLIAIRGEATQATIENQFFPKGLAFPVTAFFRKLEVVGANGNLIERFAIELRDPLDSLEVEVGQRRTPLESDISTPLAYYLNDPVVGTGVLATFALLDANFAQDFVGLYMLEPYDPNKIPVVMVHGLWSSPTTWMEMFNDLRAMPEIRENYQFWFYMYPSGQPFWKSAEQMRLDLAEAIQKLDPDRRSTSMERMVLVGHSMGGLVSRLQTIDSGDKFWRLVSDQPLEQLSANQESKRELQQVLYFEPNPFVKRVISIGTPYHGSQFANGATRWLSHRFFTLPSSSTREAQELIEQNPGFFSNTELLTINTSVDSLSPESPFLPVMLEAETAPWVHYHNVVGVLEDNSLMGKLGLRLQPAGDGVVPLESARISGVDSELVVPAAHMVVHQHPLTILEVRRILLVHLAEGASDIRVDRSIVPVEYQGAMERYSREPMIDIVPIDYQGYPEALIPQGLHSHSSPAAIPFPNPLPTQPSNGLLPPHFQAEPSDSSSRFIRRSLSSEVDSRQTESSAASSASPPSDDAPTPSPIRSFSEMADNPKLDGTDPLYR